MMSILRHCVFCLMIAVVLFARTDTVAAQTAAPAAMPSNSQPVGRSYYVEGAVVVLLMAASGYAVCRSSRRM